MLLPVTQKTDLGGSSAGVSGHLSALIVAAIPPGTTGLPRRRLDQKRQSEAADPAVDIAVAGGIGPSEAPQGLSQRMARWEPVAEALGHSVQAIVGFLRSVGVPQAEAEDMARRTAEAARQRLAVAPTATQAHFEAGRLSLKLEDVHIGFRRETGRAEVTLGKAEVAVDVDIPGHHEDQNGASIGGAEAEIGQRKVAFAYEGPGATPAYADRGASAVTFTVAAPVRPPIPSGPPSTGPVDVAI